MQSRRLFLFIIALIAAACQPAPQTSTAPTIEAFLTVTPGRAVRGFVPTAEALRLDGSSGGENLANPATAVALANLPTATPDYSACPPPASPIPSDAPNDPREIVAETERFLSAGGSAATLQDAMRDLWGVLGADGTVREIDLTGEGVPETVMAYTAPDDGGTLLIMGCVNGRVTPRYQAIVGGSAPQIINVSDMNHDGTPDLAFTNLLCAPAPSTRCEYQTQLVTWRPLAGRFLSLLNGAIRSDEQPTLVDVDNDSVIEIAVQMDNPGTEETGPLRTGTLVYDWNGGGYVLSIAQLDSPRYRIQIIQEADKATDSFEMDTAIRLYNLALNDPSLQEWIPNEGPILQSYLYYRLLTLYAFTDDPRRAEVYQDTVDTFFDPVSAPVYAALSTSFWNTLQVTGSLNSACQEVQAIIRQRPEAIGYLNRYGSNAPNYTSRSLCPF